MAQDNGGQENSNSVVSIATMKDWFVRRAKPTQSQFASVFDSYWHKGSQIPMSVIKDLGDTLGRKAESNALNYKISKSGDTMTGDLYFDPGNTPHGVLGLRSGSQALTFTDDGISTFKNQTSSVLLDSEELSISVKAIASPDVTEFTLRPGQGLVGNNYYVPSSPFTLVQKAYVDAAVSNTPIYITDPDTINGLMNANYNQGIARIITNGGEDVKAGDIYCDGSCLYMGVGLNQAVRIIIGIIG